MRIIADLHVHSRHARGCSTNLDLALLERFARMKGVSLLGTGDFTHPAWLQELKKNLLEDGTGILRSASGFPFLLQTEISLIYSAGGRGRRIHNLVLAKNFAIVDQIVETLKKRGRVDYDGRPIFGIPSPDFVELLREIDRDIEIVPAHCWTPWFGLFGSNSGFDSVQECFQDQTKHIHAIETGLSSDPPLNWRVSQLDRYTLVSFSDLHSAWPWRLGREATLFEVPEENGVNSAPVLTHERILRAIRTREGLAGTIEVDPNYGKYHYDGHRACNIRLHPQESEKHQNRCPSCGQQVTIGVLHRIEQLADRPEGYVPPGSPPFFRLLPLSELIAGVQGTAVAAKSVWKQYAPLINAFGSEYAILLDTPEEELARVGEPAVVAAVMANRHGEVTVEPGYDGVYGVPLLGQRRESERKTEAQEQKTLERKAKKRALQQTLEDFD